MAAHNEQGLWGLYCRPPTVRPLGSWACSGGMSPKDRLTSFVHSSKGENLLFLILPTFSHLAWYAAPRGHHGSDRRFGGPSILECGGASKHG